MVTVLHQIGSRSAFLGSRSRPPCKTDLIRAGFRSENAAAGVLRHPHRGHAGDAGRQPDAGSQDAAQSDDEDGADGLRLLPRAGFCRDSFWKRRSPSGRKSCACRCPTRWTCWWFRWKPGWAWTRPSSTWPANCMVSHPQLSEEMSLVTLEMRAGKRRSDALRNLAERTGEPEIRKLVAILIQNDRFGTSMGESLRTHSDFLRTRRRQEAEERAGKGRRQAGVPDFLFHSAVHADCGGGAGHSADFQVPVPDDEKRRVEEPNKEHDHERSDTHSNRDLDCGRRRIVCLPETAAQPAERNTKGRPVRSSRDAPPAPAGNVPETAAPRQAAVQPTERRTVWTSRFKERSGWERGDHPGHAVLAPAQAPGGPVAVRALSAAVAAPSSPRGPMTAPAVICGMSIETLLGKTESGWRLAVRPRRLLDRADGLRRSWRLLSAGKREAAGRGVDWIVSRVRLRRRLGARPVWTRAPG